MGKSANYGPASDGTQMISVVRGAADRGVTFFNTAEVQGPPVDEENLGSTTVQLGAAEICEIEGARGTGAKRRA